MRLASPDHSPATPAPRPALQPRRRGLRAILAVVVLAAVPVVAPAPAAATDIGPLPVLGAVTATWGPSAALDVAFTPASGALEHRASCTPSGAGATVTETAPAPAASITVASLRTATPYYCSVQARFAAGWGPLVGGAPAVAGFGADDRGQLARGTTSATVLTPTDALGALATSGTLDALGPNGGGDHGCALAASRAWCWGQNTSGQLGDGTTTYRTTPVSPSLPSPVAVVATGASFSCAVAAGDVWCWGSNTNGQLGDGTTTSSSTPVRALAPWPTPPTALALGTSHACALADAKVWCWGSNAAGQFGLGTYGGSANQGLAAAGGLTGKTVTAVRASGANTCARTDAADTASLYCWGSNANGQIGDGTATPRPLPTRSLTDVTAFAPGGTHTCAVSAGQLYCWGYNNTGQLGLGSIGGTFRSPSAVTTITAGTVRDLAATSALGSSATCALTAQLYCWGANGYGQLGDGTTSTRSTPTAVTLSFTPDAIVVGQRFALAAHFQPSVSTLGPPATPTVVADSADAARRVDADYTVTFTAVAGALGVDTVTLRCEEASDPTVVRTVTATPLPTVHAGAAAFTATITGLDTAREYGCSVRAGNEAGDSPWSAAATVRTIDLAAAPQPAAQPGDSTVTISWPPPPSGIVDTWIVTRGALEVCRTASSACTDTGLTNGTTYTYTLTPLAAGRAEHPSQTFSGTSATVSATPRGVPGVPGLSLVGTPTGIDASWTEPAPNGSSVTQYELAWSPNGLSWSSLVTTARTASLDGLTQGATYRVQVRATNAAGTGEWSLLRLMAPHTTVGTPSFTVTPGDESLTVSWPTPDGGGAQVAGYELEWRHASDASWSSITTSLRTWAVSSLTNGEGYWVRMRAKNIYDEWSVWSPPAYAEPRSPWATASPTVQTADAALVVSWAGDPATLAWSADGGATWSQLGAVPSPWTISSLRNGTTYHIRIKPPGAPDSAWSPRVVAVPQRAPAAPVPAATPGDGQLTVSWPAFDTGGGTVLEYHVQYRTGNDPWETHRATSSPTVIDSLTNGTEYTVRVRAVNSTGASAWSRLVTEVPSRAPDTPGALTVTPTATGVTVSWFAPADGGAPITGYLVDWSADGTRWQSTPRSVTNTATSFVALRDQVFFRVRATNRHGGGPWRTQEGTSGMRSNETIPAPAVTVANGRLVVHAPRVAAPVLAIAATCAGPGQYQAQASTSPVLFDALPVAASYSCSVEVLTANGWSDVSPPAPPTYLASAPAAPSVVETRYVDDQAQVTFTLNATGGAPVAAVDVRAVRPDGSTTLLEDLPVATLTGGDPAVPGALLTASFGRLTPGLAHHLSVRARNTQGYGEWSAPGPPVTPITRPGVPTAVRASSSSDTLDVSWTAPPRTAGTPVDAYHVYAGGQLVCTTQTTACALSGLVVGREYRIFVTAANQAGTSAQSLSVAAHVAGAHTFVTAPLAGLATTIANADVRVTFRRSLDRNVVGYRIVIDSARTVTTTATTWTDAGAAAVPGEHTYVIRPLSRTGAIGPARRVTVMVLSQPAPPTPIVTNTAARTVTVTIPTTVTSAWGLYQDGRLVATYPYARRSVVLKNVAAGRRAFTIRTWTTQGASAPSTPASLLVR
jgi:alpha-tubulin suppressor-like RCC1 family protein